MPGRFGRIVSRLQIERALARQIGDGRDGDLIKELLTGNKIFPQFDLFSVPVKKTVVFDAFYSMSSKKALLLSSSSPPNGTFERHSGNIIQKRETQRDYFTPKIQTPF